MKHKEIVCHSCGMPMPKTEDLGTNTDTTKSHDYCRFCYQHGKYIQASITMDQMIAQAAKHLAQKERMPLEQATRVATGYIPQLKRWQKK